MDFARLALEIRIGRNVFYANGESERQSTRWVDFAKEDVCDGIADFVSLVPCLNDRRDSVYPGHCDSRALQLGVYTTVMGKPQKENDDKIGMHSQTARQRWY